MHKVLFSTHFTMFKISAGASAKSCNNAITVHKKDTKTVFWIKMHDIQDELCVKNISYLTIKAIKGIYETNGPKNEQIKRCKRYGKELLDGVTGIYIHENFALSIIMDCRTPTSIEFRSKLGFKQHDLIMTKEQTLLTRIMTIFTHEKILLQHSALNYRFFFYFPKHKLAIEADEKGHKDKDEHRKVYRKPIEKYFGCKFIRINPDEKEFDMYMDIGKINNHINKSSKNL